jgi:hypothetical protein
VTLNQYEVDGRVFRARQGSIQAPNELQDVVTGAFGFDQRPQAVPHFRWKRAGLRGTDPSAVSSPSFNPTDLAGIYQFPTEVTGAGETIGIIELGEIKVIGGIVKAGGPVVCSWSFVVLLLSCNFHGSAESALVQAC